MVITMKQLFTLQQQQRYFEQAQQLMNAGQLDDAEELLRLIIESAQQNDDYTTYTTSMLLLLRILNNTQRYSEAFPFLERIKNVITQYGNDEEQYLFLIQVAIFNYIHGIGNPIAEFEELADKLRQSSFPQLYLILLNNLLDVYFEHQMHDKGLQLYEDTKDLFSHATLDERYTHVPFLFLINAFRLFYVHKDYAMCQQLIAEIDDNELLQCASSFSVLYWSCKALLEIRLGNEQQALQYFEKFRSMMTTPYYFLPDIELWIAALKERGLLNEVIKYQRVALDALKAHVKLEENTKRASIINQMSKRYYEESMYTDYLTNVKNRNFYENYSSKEQHVKNFTMVVLDIDHFKKVNDTYGHTVGDQAIRFIAKLLRDWCPKHDISLIRYGGDEFILLMPYPYKEMQHYIQELHELLHTTPFRLRNSAETLQLSASIGIGHTTTAYVSVKDLFQIADTALYEAKQQRGQLVVKQV